MSTDGVPDQGLEDLFDDYLYHFDLLESVLLKVFLGSLENALMLSIHFSTNMSQRRKLFCRCGN